MSELTRPIRRLLGRGDRSVDAAPAGARDPVVDAPRTASEPAAATDPAIQANADAAAASIAVDIPESDPLLAYLQTAPGSGRPRPARARLAGGPRPCVRPASRWSFRSSPRAS